uniref:Ribonuclease P protein subunit p29 n=1 Tax=Panagrellus redivivus TaxID=6233 RepID=A0A7E4VC08_PANRE
MTDLKRDFDTSECMFLQLDPCGKKVKPGPKSTAPQNLVKRAGGLKKEDLKYAEFVPLYDLWCGYFSQVLASAPRLDERLLKVDLHGCILVVCDSPNPSQIGVHGIVLHESKSTFQMLTKKDKLAVIQKEHTTFQFVFEGRVFTLFGSALCQRSFARGKKFKGRLELPFFLPQPAANSEHA